MELSDITPLILTKNEEANLGDSLRRLQWATRVVVIDSGSVDRTLEIAAAYPNVSLIHRPFDNHRDQWNFGLDNVHTPWVLALDADFKCTEELVDEFRSMVPDKKLYRSRFIYAVFGKPLRCSLYPAKPVLFDAKIFRYVLDGHTQALDVQDYPVGALTAKIIHDDRKPISSWFEAQYRYAVLEANKLNAKEVGKLSLQDRIRRYIFIAPLLIFFYCMIYRLLILDGLRGAYYTMQRVYAELQLSMELLDRKIRETFAQD
jgi:glycosyltransferase involved in cell wall biosynthesis